MKKPLLIALLSIAAACSGPDEKSATDTGTTTEDAGQEMGGEVSDDAGALDAGSGDAGNAFGFDPALIDFEVNGIHTAMARVDALDSAGDVLIVAQEGRVNGTLNVARSDGDYTHRFWGEVDVLGGTFDLTVTAGTCATCTPLPEEVRNVGRYTVEAAYDGDEVVFGDFRLLADAPTSFEEPIPTDLVMVPNDGFKPAMVPSAVGTWTGLVSSSDDTSVFGGTQTCSFVIEQPATDFVLSDMSCGERDFTADADPGPVPSSLYVEDATDFVVEFDFVDDGSTYRFAANLGQDEMVGVIVDASAANAPFEASPDETLGVFVLSRSP